MFILQYLQSDRDDIILDPRLISRIHELQASSQVKTITDMKFLLKEFVTDVLCKDEELPHKKDRRFFPTVSDIRLDMRYFYFTWCQIISDLNGSKSLYLY